MNFVDTLSNNEIILEGVSFRLLPLGDFFKLSSLTRDLREAFRVKDKKLFDTTLKEILFLQTHGRLSPHNFLDHIKLLYQIIAQNKIQAQVAIFQPPKKEAKDTGEKISWNYDGRTLAIWINAFASAYHWTLNEILNLPLNTAVYLYQEIAVSEQLEREWQYSLTELAYPYNETTKKSEYKPLPRPDWMSVEADKLIPVSKINVDMLPFGVVEDLSGMGKLSQNEQNFNVPEELQKEG